MCSLANAVWILHFALCPLSVAIRGWTLQGITVGSSGKKIHDWSHYHILKTKNIKYDSMLLTGTEGGFALFHNKL